MGHVDNAAAIRDRAYEIWEREGRPSGREHEHWAEARLQIEGEQAERMAGFRIDAIPLAFSTPPLSPEAQDAARLRKALYEPEVFSFELFGAECPDVHCPELVARRPAPMPQRNAA